MMIFDAIWLKYNLPIAALHELKALVGIDDAAPPVVDENKIGSEARQQSLVRLAAPHHDFWLTRNNVGALLDKGGRPVRFGLWNESPKQNEVFKSPDLIGIYKWRIQQHHVGSIVGQFAGIEMKEEDWVFNPADAHEVAQLNCINQIINQGGYATFATGPHIFTGDKK